MDDEGIIEDGEDGEEYEYVGVGKVEKLEFGCQTEAVEAPVTHVSPSMLLLPQLNVRISAPSLNLNLSLCLLLTNPLHLRLWIWGFRLSL